MFFNQTWSYIVPELAPVTVNFCVSTSVDSANPTWVNCSNLTGEMYYCSYQWASRLTPTQAILGRGVASLGATAIHADRQ